METNNSDVGGEGVTIRQMRDIFPLIVKKINKKLITKIFYEYYHFPDSTIFIFNFCVKIVSWDEVLMVARITKNIVYGASGRNYISDKKINLSDSFINLHLSEKILDDFIKVINIIYTEYSNDTITEAHQKILDTGLVECTDEYISQSEYNSDSSNDSTFYWDDELRDLLEGRECSDKTDIKFNKWKNSTE